jgi:hypothetical protein
MLSETVDEAGKTVFEPPTSPADPLPPHDGNTKWCAAPPATAAAAAFRLRYWTAAVRYANSRVFSCADDVTT